MKKVIFDTNIYGNIIIDEKSELSKNKLNQFIIYGNKVIKNELRNAPKKKDKYSKNLRMDLLRLYDDLVKHDLKITKEVIELAENYYRIYKEFKGYIQYKKIINDFIIVACASLYKLDIVISSDEKSMLSINAVRAYNIVNEIKKLRTPDFINYEKFKRWLL